MNNSKLSLKAWLDKVGGQLSRIRPYSLLIFIVFVALIYGFVILKFNSLRDAEPSSDAVSSQVKAAQIPHVDPAVVSQLESLQDNSVSVKTLFDQARSNPFQ